MRTMISAVVIFVVSGLICGGVGLGDPLKGIPRGPLGEHPKQRVARTLITGRPTIDFGSCPEVEVVQDFDKDAVSAGNLFVCTYYSVSLRDPSSQGEALNVKNKTVLS